MPEFVDRLESGELDTAFSDTRRLRHDGWTAEEAAEKAEALAQERVAAEAQRDSSFGLDEAG